MKFQIDIIPSLIIVLLSSLLFIPYLGSVHLFDWDEINFAESAREMILTGNYSQVQINFNPFWEKPPLFIWLQVLSMKMFGINEFAARFPNALFGVFTLLLIYNFAKKKFKGHVAHWWVLAYLGAITPHFYFKTGLIDPVFNFFIFLSILQFYEAVKNHQASYNSNIHFIKAGIFTGIAILCKGPVALLIGILVLFAIVFAKRMVWYFNFWNLFLYGLLSLLVCSVWFLPETIKNGPYFLTQFIQYQIGLFSQNIAGHQQPFYYHTLVLLLGCFPISLIVLFGYKKNEFYTYNENLFRTVMQVLFWVVLILFSIVKTKIVHYSSLCWLPLTFLAAYAIESFSHRIFKFKAIYAVVIALIGIIISSALIYLPFLIINNKNMLMSWIKDDFTKQNILAPVAWSYWDILPGAVLLFSVLIFIFIYFKSTKLQNAFGVLLIGVMCFVFLASVFLTPKIEAHTQNSIIQFYESKQNENCYLYNVGYKTYAPYFYAKTKPLQFMDGLNLKRQLYFRTQHVNYFLELNEQERNELDAIEKYWLMNSNIDKKVYFIAKIDNQQGMDTLKQLKKIVSQNGFIVYERVSLKTSTP